MRTSLTMLALALSLAGCGDGASTQRPEEPKSGLLQIVEERMRDPHKHGVHHGVSAMFGDFSTSAVLGYGDLSSIPEGWPKQIPSDWIDPIAECASSSLMNDFNESHAVDYRTFEQSGAEALSQERIMSVYAMVGRVDGAVRRCGQRLVPLGELQTWPVLAN